MKKIILTYTLLCFSIFAFGQDNKEINLIQVDNTWRKETVQIPPRFAPEINYKGFEDIRFAKGWGKLDSDGFLTFAFAWDVNLNSKPTTTLFEDNLKLYFDGLMNLVNQDSSLIIPKTKASFKEEKQLNEVTNFIGTVEIYDAFTTKKPIVLNVIIESHYCQKTKTYFPLFKFSPKDFKHKTWDMLNQVKLNNSCEN